MKAFAEKLGWWFADVALGLLYVALIALPLNFLLVWLWVWVGIPAQAGWPDPTTIQMFWIAVFLALLDGRLNRKANANASATADSAKRVTPNTAKGAP